jgi:hypothetical protein
VTDEEFEATAAEAGVSLRTWYNTYVEECRDKGKTPTALEFAYWLPFAYGFQEGIEFAESHGGSIVALVEAASQAEVLNYACDFCGAEPHVGCMNPAGQPLDRALFHLDRYNTACEPDDNLQEEKNAT